MAAKPLVSIVMPCYDAAAHLPASVGSVLAQSFADWELVAVDDGSRDATLAWLQAQRDPRIRVLSQPNQGVSAARNAGLAAARGRYVAFLDADDTWAQDFLEAMVDALQARPDKAETLFAGCRWPIHAALVRREAVTAANGFDPRLRNAEDYALWLRVALSGALVRVPRVLAFYHFHGAGQASDDAVRAALHHLDAQRAYLQSHPALAAQLGRARVRALTAGELLRRGYACYWRRDLPAARTIFRAVMRLGYGTLSDWKYMLPAWLPESWHRRLIDTRERHARTSDEQS